MTTHAVPFLPHPSAMLRMLTILIVCCVTVFAQEKPGKVIGDFAKGLHGWEYNGGWEFPGAEGSLVREAKQQHAGKAAVRLIGDFTSGGSYVAMRKVVQADLGEFRMWVQCENASAIAIRLQDSTGQVFQHRVPLKETKEWQRVVITQAKLTESEHWGGSNDGAWHGPLAEVWIMYCGFLLRDEQDGALLVTEIEVVPPAK